MWKPPNTLAISHTLSLSAHMHSLYRAVVRAQYGRTATPADIRKLRARTAAYLRNVSPAKKLDGVACGEWVYWHTAGKHACPRKFATSVRRRRVADALELRVLCAIENARASLFVPRDATSVLRVLVCGRDCSENGAHWNLLMIPRETGGARYMAMERFT